MIARAKLSNSTLIEFDDKPIGSGGEADVFHIVSPSTYRSQVVKLYKINSPPHLKENKLEFLVHNKPALNPSGHQTIIWPTHLVYISGVFSGYTMPHVEGVPLEHLCGLNIPKKLGSAWDKFSFQNSNGFNSRLKLCYNLATAVSLIHASGNYVLVDLKPNNVLVKPNGFISIIDLDSIEVISGSKLLFPAKVATPEYTPPEFHRIQYNLEHQLIPETWDRFSIAVIIYRLLFGIHPYTASLKHPYDKLTSTPEIISKGFFPNGRHKDKFHVIPHPHHRFKLLDPNLQELFLSAFDAGTDNDRLRPSADDWCRALTPTPGIRVKRKLPSDSFTFKDYYKISHATSLKPRPPLVINKPNFISKRKSTGFFSLLLDLFNTKDDQRYHEIKQKQGELLNIGLAVETLANELDNEKGRQENKIACIIKHEEEIIDKLFNTLLDGKIKIDNKAKQLFANEEKEYTDFETNHSSQVSALEFTLKNRHGIIFDNLNEERQNQTLDLLQILKSLESSESTQISGIEASLQNELSTIKKASEKIYAIIDQAVKNEFQQKIKVIDDKANLLASKEKLAQTKSLEAYQSQFIQDNLGRIYIADDMHSIFIDNHAMPNVLVTNLNRFGFRSASDIKGVDDSGKILNSHGRWIKVPEIGSVRATRLNQWRSNKEKLLTANLPQSLPYSDAAKVSALFSQERNSINEARNRINHEMIARKKQVLASNVPSTELAKLEEHEKKLLREATSAKIKISEKFADEKMKVKKKIDQINSDYTHKRAHLQSIYDQDARQINEELEKLESAKTEFYAAAKQKYDLLHQELQSELTSLISEFNFKRDDVLRSTKYDINAIINDYEVMYSKVTKELNEYMAKYTVQANLLVVLQNNYELN